MKENGILIQEQAMIRTKFYYDFLDYHHKAELLQNKNIGKGHPSTKVNDPLMDNVHIYDCVERKYAGFSNALEDLHGTRLPEVDRRLPEYKFDLYTWNFIHLFHRFTGSGASFESDHGYRNSHVGRLAEIGDVDKMVEFILENKEPMVTSKGNQPPSIKNPDPEKYRLAQHFYFDKHARDFIKDYTDYIKEGPVKNIKEAVDWCLDWHSGRGFKRWKFIMTAFVMDNAEYNPGLINPWSHCYYGKNATNSMNLMYQKSSRERILKNDWEEVMMEDLVKATKNKPYNLEDVLCDYIRYIKQFVPANDYEHLGERDKWNYSLLKSTANGKAYPMKIQELIDKV